MAWRETSVLDQRVDFVLRASASHQSFTELCGQFGISRPTGYRWLKRYLQTRTVNCLKDRSRRPIRCPHRTNSKAEKAVIRLRLERGWGAKKLQIFLDREGICLPTSTINRIIKRHGLVRPEGNLTFAKKRFERKQPNELWQMDFKGEFRNANGICYPLTILDDHSRYLVGIFSLRNTQSPTVEKCLIDVFEQNGLPEEMLTDHGSPWWCTTSEHGLTHLTVQLIKQGIKLRYSGVGHPQTQGKIERFHRTLKQEVHHHGEPKTFAGWTTLFAKIRQSYNEERPHEGIGMSTPRDRYRISPRAYLPKPPAWEYPPKTNVLKVDSAGCIRIDSRQYFVSKSLESEQVRVDTTEDNLVVSYRHMLIREINRVTGHGKPILLPSLET